MSASAFRLCVLSLATLSATVRIAAADPVVLYSNFGAAPGFVQEEWATAPCCASGRHFWTSQTAENVYLMAFTVPTTAVFESATIPAVWNTHEPIGFFFRLVELAEGQTRFATFLESQLVAAPTGAQPLTANWLSFPSAQHPVLSPDVTYALGIVPSGQFGTSVWWPWNNAGVEGLVINNHVPGVLSFNTGTLGAFQIIGDVSPTPEPGTILLFGSGGLMLLRRMRAGHRSTGEQRKDPAESQRL